jgi:hypothetical protein
MKDLTGIELNAGDLILDVRTNASWYSLGLVEGTTTKSGNVRYYSIWDRRKHTQEKNIIKISKEQFNQIFNKLITKDVIARTPKLQDDLNIGYNTIDTILKLIK